MQRRIVLHVMVAVVVALLVTLTPASAHVSWCSSDPVVALPDGSIVNVVVEAPVDFAGSHVWVGLLAQQGAELIEVINGDLILHPSFSDGLYNPNFLVVARPIGDFPLRVTVLRDNVVVDVKEGSPGASVRMWLQF